MRDYILRMSAFFMDNPAWTALAEEARGYVGALKVTQSNSVREETIEECAQVADRFHHILMRAAKVQEPSAEAITNESRALTALGIAGTIRALLSPTDSGSVGKGEVNEG